MLDQLNERIAALRKERGFTLEQLGQMVGVSAQAVSKWEKGGAPDVSLLPAVADALGVSIDSLFGRVEEAGSEDAFGARLLADTCVLQLMVALNRDFPAAEAAEGAYRFDPKMEEVTRFIREHLAEELTIERLSGAFFLSRYYLMHRFKDVYGCTVHQYIRQKRLQQAAEQIRLGVPVLKAAGDAGFRDYSVFLRAFRGAFGKSPRQWK